MEHVIEFPRGHEAPASDRSHPGWRPSLVDGALAGFVRRYLRTWGVSDRTVADAAAKRLLAEMSLENLTGDRGELQRKLVSLTRRWVEAFAREDADAKNDWFFRAQTLLGRYPQTFLETPIPGTTHESAPLSLLPETTPRLMIQQGIVDSLDRLKSVLHETSERLRGNQLGTESRRLIEPSP